MNAALAYTIGVCAIAVALESLFAGRGIQQRLADIRLPRFAPPLWGWFVIGAGYYLICSVVLYRLLSLPVSVGLRQWALVLVGAILFVNALWNLFFFRTQNLFHAFVVGLLYVGLALILLGVLWHVDRSAAWSFLPYTVYLAYASWFGYRVWKFNPSPVPEERSR